MATRHRNALPDPDSPSEGETVLKEAKPSITTSSKPNRRTKYRHHSSWWSSITNPLTSWLPWYWGRSRKLEKLWGKLRDIFDNKFDLEDLVDAIQEFVYERSGHRLARSDDCSWWWSTLAVVWMPFWLSWMILSTLFGPFGIFLFPIHLGFGNGFGIGSLFSLRAWKKFLYLTVAFGTLVWIGELIAGENVSFVCLVPGMSSVLSECRPHSIVDFPGLMDIQKKLVELQTVVNEGNKLAPIFDAAGKAIQADINERESRSFRTEENVLRIKEEKEFFSYLGSSMMDVQRMLNHVQKSINKVVSVSENSSSVLGDIIPGRRSIGFLTVLDDWRFLTGREQMAYAVRKQFDDHLRALKREVADRIWDTESVARRIIKHDELTAIIGNVLPTSAQSAESQLRQKKKPSVGTYLPIRTYLKLSVCHKMNMNDIVTLQSVTGELVGGMILRLKDMKTSLEELEQSLTGEDREEGLSAQQNSILEALKKFPTNKKTSEEKWNMQKKVADALGPKCKSSLFSVLVSAPPFRKQSGWLSGFKFPGSWNKSPKEPTKGKRSGRASDNSAGDILKDAYLFKIGDNGKRYGKIHGPVIQAIWHLILKPWYLMTNLGLTILRIITEIIGTILSKPVMLITKILSWLLGWLWEFLKKKAQESYLKGTFPYEGPGKDTLLDFLGIERGDKNLWHWLESW